MTPMIRVDDEVYAYLNERGRTEDSFNDVIRREFGLLSKKANDTKSVKEMNLDDDDSSKIPAESLEKAIDRRLPPRWADSKARREQIYSVISVFLKTPQNWEIAERHIYAAKHVAKKYEVEVTTILDKSGRQLYGEGVPQVETFRQALSQIETDLRGENRP